MLCSHFTQNCILLYFLEAKNPYFVTKNCWKSSYISVFILSKKRRNWLHKNLHNSGMDGRRKLSDPSLNCIFNALSIDVQYTPSFQWTKFGRKCLMRCKLLQKRSSYISPLKKIFFPNLTDANLYSLNCSKNTLYTGIIRPPKQRLF